MLDTIRLYSPAFFGIYKGKIDVTKFNTYENTNNDYTLFNTFYNENGKAPINIKYNVKGDYLVMTFSIPKMIYENSLQEFNYTKNEMLQLIDTLDKRLEGIIEIDYLQMRVSRIDVAVNIETDLGIAPYLKAVDYCSKVSKKYKIQEFKGTSLIISNNSKRILFYDKEVEQLKSKELNSKYKLTGKILRFEIQLKNTKTIRKELKLSKNTHLTFYDILTSPEVFSNYLVKEFDKLTKGYTKNSELNEFQSDLAIVKAISKKFKKNELAVFLKIKYGDHLDKDYLKALFSQAGMSTRKVDYFFDSLKGFELNNLDKKNINLIKEISKKIENKVCKFQPVSLHLE